MSLQMLKFYEIHTAVNVHFGGKNYDYFKYEGRTSVSETSFLKLKDKHFYERWKAKCPDEETALGLCVSNNVAGNTYIMKYSGAVYKEWMVKADKLEYNFSDELDKYLAAKKTSGGEPPLELLVNMVLSEQLSREFLILFNIVMDGLIYSELDKTTNFVWEDLKTQQLKYAPFLKILWNIHPGIIIKLKNIAKTK